MIKLEWETKKVKVSELIELEFNPRKISDEKRKKLIESLDKFNLVEIPAVNTDMKIIGGNQRVKALLLAGRGDEFIDIRYPNRQLTQKEVKEYNLISNSHSGEFDFDIIMEEFGDINFDEIGFDIDKIEFETSDFFEKSMKKFEDLKGSAEQLDAKEDDYEIPEEIKTDIVLGDLIEIGKHRLLCGDATDSDQVAKLMNGEKADMVFTDPPYGVSYQSNMRTKTEKFDVLENDNIFITEWINNLPLFSKGFVFVWTSWKVLKQWIEFCEPIGELSNIIVWDKGGGGIGDLKKTFLTDFEIALVYNRGAEIKGKRLGSVWSIGKDGSTKYLHPTQKPVELSYTAIENITLKNEVVLDLFLGSGSTMVAAHQLNRKCYGMELEPKYCQVIIDRMLKLDNTLKVKINSKDVTDKYLKKY